MSFLEAVGSDHNGLAIFGDERAGLGERVRVVGAHSGHVPLLALAVLDGQGYFHAGNPTPAGAAEVLSNSPVSVP